MPHDMIGLPSAMAHDRMCPSAMAQDRSGYPLTDEGQGRERNSTYPGGEQIWSSLLQPLLAGGYVPLLCS